MLFPAILANAKHGRVSKMTYEIGPNCITCGRCEANCPVHCIFPGIVHYEITEEQCVGCGTCVTLCPMDAIHPKHTS